MGQMNSKNKHQSSHTFSMNVTHRLSPKAIMPKSVQQMMQNSYYCVVVSIHLDCSTITTTVLHFHRTGTRVDTILLIFVRSFVRVPTAFPTPLLPKYFLCPLVQSLLSTTTKNDISIN